MTVATLSRAEAALDFLAGSRPEAPRWGGPMSLSISTHAVILFLLLWAWTVESSRAPVKVLEINVMGAEDLSLKGTGQDAGRGPEKAEALAAPPKPTGPVQGGNTAKLSRSLRRAAREAPAALAPLGPLFGRGDRVAAQRGVGREKIYATASASSLYAGNKEAPSIDGAGLAGVPSQAIDLNAKRRGGGEEGGEGNFLGGGAGSVDGGLRLSRRGESILAEYAASALPAVKKAEEAPPLPDPGDSFFSISGPLSRRKILSMKLPHYPRWAEESGLEAQISVHLTVAANGKVKAETAVEQTSGYPDFDKIVVEAVRAIRFAPLPERDLSHEEWGVATFNFKLKNGRRKA